MLPRHFDDVERHLTITRDPEVITEIKAYSMEVVHEKPYGPTSTTTRAVIILVLIMGGVVPKTGSLGYLNLHVVLVALDDEFHRASLRRIFGNGTPQSRHTKIKDMCYGVKVFRTASAIKGEVYTALG